MVVENIIANQNEDMLGNNAELSYVGPLDPMTRNYDADANVPGFQPLNLTLVEPLLEIRKSADRDRLPPGAESTFTLLIDHAAAILLLSCIVP